MAAHTVKVKNPDRFASRDIGGKALKPLGEVTLEVSESRYWQLRSDTRLRVTEQSSAVTSENEGPERPEEMAAERQRQREQQDKVRDTNNAVVAFDGVKERATQLGVDLTQVEGAYRYQNRLTMQDLTRYLNPPTEGGIDTEPVELSNRPRNRESRAGISDENRDEPRVVTSDEDYQDTPESNDDTEPTTEANPADNEPDDGSDDGDRDPDQDPGEPDDSSDDAQATTDSGIPITDSARQRAEKYGVDLSQCEATGADGQIISRDVENAAQNQGLK